MQGGKDWGYSTSMCLLDPVQRGAAELHKAVKVKGHFEWLHSRSQQSSSDSIIGWSIFKLEN